MKMFLILAFACLSLPALAEGENDRPCKADREKYCGSVTPGQGAVVRCMKENESKLTGECRAHIEQMKSKLKEKFGEAREACKGDAEKFCSGVKPGQGAIIKCLKQHEAELSDACKAVKKNGRKRGRGRAKED